MKSLISYSFANSKEYSSSPALDASAKIVFTESDGTPSAYTGVYNVASMNILPSGKHETPYWLKGIYDNWEVYVTDRRIAVRNPFVMGLFKSKQKSGEASVGQIPYNTMTNLIAFINKEDIPTLACIRFMHDGQKSYIAIVTKDINLLKKIATDVHGRVDKWLIANDRKLVIDEKADANMREAVDKWNDFLNKAWSSNAEVNAFVPAKEFNYK